MGIPLLIRPFLFLWAGLNLIDSISFGLRVTRLVAGSLLYKYLPNGEESDALCGVCDGVMGDLLAGSDGLSAIPCGAACLGFRNCTKMCESVKKTSAVSIEFPCLVRAANRSS